MKRLLLKWCLGFVLLIALDAFMEVFVFEWLAWNGTTKNDWFFLLWWILVFGWIIYGLVKWIRFKK
ncbi:MAG: hypothetical protein ACPH63_05380 [Flavobacteriaceae bacterium]